MTPATDSTRELGGQQLPHKGLFQKVGPTVTFASLRDDETLPDTRRLPQGPKAPALLLQAISHASHTPPEGLRWERVSPHHRSCPLLPFTFLLFYGMPQPVSLDPSEAWFQGRFTCHGYQKGFRLGHRKNEKRILQFVVSQSRSSHGATTEWHRAITYTHVVHKCSCTRTRSSHTQAHPDPLRPLHTHEWTHSTHRPVCTHTHMHYGQSQQQPEPLLESENLGHNQEPKVWCLEDGDCGDRIPLSSGASCATTSKLKNHKSPLCLPAIRSPGEGPVRQQRGDVW